MKGRRPPPRHPNANPPPASKSPVLPDAGRLHVAKAAATQTKRATTTKGRRPTERRPDAQPQPSTSTETPVAGLHVAQIATTRTEVKLKQPAREDRKRSRLNVKNSEDDCDRESRTKRQHDVNVAALQRSPHVGKNRMRSRSFQGKITQILKIEIIAKFNEIQKQSVRDLGFVALLHLDIKDVPPKITYRVLDNFNTKQCEIVLEGDRCVRVGEDDEVDLQFPMRTPPCSEEGKKCRSELI